MKTIIDIDSLSKEVFSIHHQTAPWEWASGEINYRNAPNYDTPYRGSFDPELMPFWKEPLEMAHDKNVREIVLMKCSRAGYSENLLLTDLRYTIARQPEPTLYVSGSMDLVKGFLERRVIRGMNLASELRKKYKYARQVAQDIQFADMDFRATWASSDSATKQDGWARIHCDEVSLWKEFTVDMIRRRAAAYPFHHIIYGGSIDPTRKGNPEEDPVLKLYEESDKRVWTMQLNDEEFTFALGGIKWPNDAKVDDDWDLEAVRKNAWYETPEGQRIEESERMDVVRSGHWTPTAEGSRIGYKVVSAMVPFADCTFGEIAARFLSAKNRMNLTGRKQDKAHNTLRTYFAEHWAEAHREDEVNLTNDALDYCASDYEIGFPNIQEGWQSGVVCTVDVQKYHYWWLARTWAFKDDQVHSSLLDYGNVASIADLDAKLAGFEPSMVGIDIGYALRQTEVADYCSEYTDTNPRESKVVAMRGSDKLVAVPLDPIVRDAAEGRTKAGFSPFLELVWSTDTFRLLFFEMLNSGEWYIPKKWRNAREQNTYVKQVTSTRKADGEWLVSGRDDHLFDCEVMQLVLARWDGLL